MSDVEPEASSLGRIRLATLEIRGFRSFGVEARVLQLDESLVVVHAGNSQGKTSLAEALEFLISGRSSRRDLLGGAKAEYNDSLRNAHLPAGDTGVYVEAVVRLVDGTLRRIRRELVSDFGQGTECESRLLLEGIEVASLDSVGLALADPPVRAPVLLQHILRHALSTEPKQRVGYFKSMLSLTDLDQLRERLRAARSSVESQPLGATLLQINQLDGTPAVNLSSAILSLTKKPLTTINAATAVDDRLLSAGKLVIASVVDSVGYRGGERWTSPQTLAELESQITEVIAAQREDAFPLAPLALGQRPTPVSAPDLEPYRAALVAADRQAARVAPILSALLSIDEYNSLNEPLDCPVCGTDHALTPDRIGELQVHLQRTHAVDDAAQVAIEALRDARRDLGKLTVDVSATMPESSTWTSDRIRHAHESLAGLGVEAELFDDVLRAAGPVSTAVADIDASIALVRTVLEQAGDAVARREVVPEDIGEQYIELAARLTLLASAHVNHATALEALRVAVDRCLVDQVSAPGLREFAALLARRDALVTDLVQEASRQSVIRRANNAEKVLRAASSAVLDDRFAKMSDTITSWWKSIRPEELVGFGGIKRRAGGALFVNLVAALRADAGSDVIERDALGVYSDSQLNALGLSIFLARTELLGAPVVVLDDPIPGSDADHRLTFVQNTISKLLDAGVQVILTTFDSKLAEWTQANHDWRGLAAYELNLLDATAGTEVTQTSDTFSRLLLEAEENLNSPTPRGRRAACGSYRSAAERLAKQIIATGRTHDGQLTSVNDVDREAAVLGALVPLVNGYALDNAEKGQWRTFASVLNPGNHDDDVPSTAELKQVRGNLRKIAKAHRAHWPGALLL